MVFAKSCVKKFRPTFLKLNHKINVTWIIMINERIIIRKISTWLVKRIQNTLMNMHWVNKFKYWYLTSLYIHYNQVKKNWKELRKGPPRNEVMKIIIVIFLYASFYRLINKFLGCQRVLDYWLYHTDHQSIFLSRLLIMIFCSFNSTRCLSNEPKGKKISLNSQNIVQL